MAPDDRLELTPLLHLARQGDPAARDLIAETIYQPLHRVAIRFMGEERVGHTLTPTALLHEGLLRLFQDDTFAKAASSQYLMGAAVQAMRRVLIKHEQQRQTQKRGGGMQRRSLSADLEAPDSFDRVELDDALSALAVDHERESYVVTLRYFGKFTVAETAELLGVCVATVEQDWRFARAWLRRRLGP